MIYIIIILFVGAILVSALLLFPRHPSPEYSVNTYEELSEEINGLCFLPEGEVLPSIEGKYTVYLKSRFSNRIVGYIMSFNPTENYAEELTVACQSINVLQNESLQMIPTASYSEIELSVDRSHICFVMDGFRYDIHGNEVTDAFSQIAMSIAQSIINAQTKTY